MARQENQAVYILTIIRNVVLVLLIICLISGAFNMPETTKAQLTVCLWH